MSSKIIDNALRFNPNLQIDYVNGSASVKFGEFESTEADVELTLKSDASLQFITKPGCHVIFAREGTGKSLFARMIIEAVGERAFALRMQEPEVDASSPEAVENAIKGFSSRHFEKALKNPNVGLIMFDSLKATFRRKIAADSTTMSNGIESSFLEFLSDLSLAGLLTGRSYVVVVNPGLIKGDAYEAIRGAMAGAATSVVEPKGVERTNGIIRLSVSSRIGDREYTDVTLAVNEQRASALLVDLTEDYSRVLTGGARDLPTAILADRVENLTELETDPIVIILGDNDKNKDKSDEQGNI